MPFGNKPLPEPMLISHLWGSVGALRGLQLKAPGYWKSNGALAKFYLRAQWTLTIGEFVMNFCGGSRGTLENLLGSLENSHSEGPGPLTHWGRVTHICVGNLSIIGSDNGSAPGRRQAIIWTNAGILLFQNLGTNFSEISIKIHTFSFKIMHLKMSSGKWRPSCLGLNVLTNNVYQGSVASTSPESNFTARDRTTCILYEEFEKCSFKSLWPSNTIWWQISGSTLGQVMACCLTAPSHYLNQCWLIISAAQWHSY